jgi:hypothetical protein
LETLGTTKLKTENWSGLVAHHIMINISLTSIIVLLEKEAENMYGCQCVGWGDDT